MKNKFLNAVLSLIIAFGLWLYVITVVSPNFETTYTDIPVAMQGQSVLEERGLMVTSVETPSVDLRLSGNRIELNKMTSANISVVADLSKIYEEGNQSVLYSISYPADVNPASFEELSKSPTQIRLKVERRLAKQVKVRPVYSGSVPEGYIADKENAILDYTEITVTGPASVVERIEQARVEVDLSEQTQTISQAFGFTLCDGDAQPVDAAQILTNVAEVNLTLSVRQTKEVKLTLTVIPGGGATEATSKITIEPSTIKICGSETLLAGIDEINIGTIDLGELTKDTSRSFDVIMPPGVTNLSEVTAATAYVQFVNLRTKTLSFASSDIKLLNVPEDLEVKEMVTKALYINVRGPRDLIDKIEAQHVTVTVDPSEWLAGMTNYAPTITFDPAFAGVGTMGTYTVSIDLQPAGADETAP